MARQNEIDPWARLRALERRLEILERANPLNNASIDGGSGLRVATPEGLRVKDGGSQTVEGTGSLEVKDGGKIDVKSAGGVKAGVDGAVEVTATGGVKFLGDGSAKAGEAELSAKFGGHVKAGTTTIGSDGIVRSASGTVGFGSNVEVAGTGTVKANGAEMGGVFGRVGAGGTWISNDGGIRNDNGTVTVVHRINPLDGVLATWNGARHTIEQITGWLQGDINSVSGRTTTAQGRADDAYSLASTANGTANSANSTANSAYSLADAAATPNEVTAQIKAAVDSRFGEIKSTFNAHVDSYHPGGQKITF